MRTTAWLVPLALGLAACTTMDPYYDGGYPPQVPYGEPGPAPYPPQPYPPQPYPDPNYPQPGYPDPGYPVPPGANDYRASGTEPFWDLTIGRDMVFTDRGTGLTVSQPTPQVITGVAGEIYRTPRLEVNVTHTACNDGMSDRTYPDTVQVYVDGRLYRGCGGGGVAAGAGDPLAPVPPGGAAPPPQGPTNQP